MNSVVNIICTLMKDKEYKPPRRLNRYAVEVEAESDGKHAFLFSTPIYRSNKQSVECSFVKNESSYCFTGSNCRVEITKEGAIFRKKEGDVYIRWAVEQNFILGNNGEYLQSEAMRVHPTLNGIAVCCQHASHTQLTFDTNMHSELPMKHNDKYCAYMADKFRPFFVINGMFAQNSAQSVFGGVGLTLRKQSATQYIIDLKAASENTDQIIWEANFYESKTTQDTTVESRNPKTNNVFGDIAFVGRSQDFGVQYLYLRFDHAKFAEVKTKDLKRVVLHIPYYAIKGDSFQISAPFRRFCSFGSNWQNRVSSVDLPIAGVVEKNIVSFDLSKYMLTPSGDLIVTNGLVLRMTANEEFAILATADNYFTPQILEFQYK